MSKSLFFLSVLMIIAIHSFAQIPNSGFENWTNAGLYEDLDGWGTANSSSPTAPGATKSTDHYPINVGNYSLRLENDTLINAYLGLAMTGSLAEPHPAFAIIGHPTSLTGYYKFFPLNGDTMYIQIKLFLNGIDVVVEKFSYSDSQTTWAPFSISIPTYTTADSAHIILAACYVDGPSFEPHGNSILYIDNLNFDDFITGIDNSYSNYPGKFDFALQYQNSFNGGADISFEILSESFVSLKILDVLGREVETIVSRTLASGSHTVKWNANNIQNGIYFCSLQTENYSQSRRIIVLK